jgi:hypothetical protein
MSGVTRGQAPGHFPIISEPRKVVYLQFQSCYPPWKVGFVHCLFSRRVGAGFLLKRSCFQDYLLISREVWPRATCSRELYTLIIPR